MKRIALLSLLALAGCVSAPQIEVSWYNRFPEQIATCQKLVAELPGGVLDQGRRELYQAEYDTEKLWLTTAVWGDPPIVLKCGVDATADKFAFNKNGTAVDPVEVNGITWQAWDLSKVQSEPENAYLPGSGYRFKATGLSVDVYVTVPRAYAPETGVLADLSTVLSKYKKV